MKTTYAIAAIALVAVVMGMSAFAPAMAADKVIICHFEGNGDSHTIEVTASSLPAHLANHGDALDACPT